MATTPPTDLLHRATLINRALIPIYNHVFTVHMSLPITTQITKDLCTVGWVNFSEFEFTVCGSCKM